MKDSKKRRWHTLPAMLVPSARIGLTSLFGMGRGEPYCYNHLKVVNPELVSGSVCVNILIEK